MVQLREEQARPQPQKMIVPGYSINHEGEVEQGVVTHRQQTRQRHLSSGMSVDMMQVFPLGKSVLNLRYISFSALLTLIEPAPDAEFTEASSRKEETDASSLTLEWTESSRLCWACCICRLIRDAKDMGRLALTSGPALGPPEGDLSLPMGT